jgi:hypothetical protein
MAFAQGTIRGIIYDEVGSAILHVKFEYAHDIGVDETGNSSSLGTKVFHIIFIEARMQNFNGGSGIEVDMLTEVNLGKAALPKQADEAVVSKLLSDTICHHHLLSRQTFPVLPLKSIYSYAL